MTLGAGALKRLFAVVVGVYLIVLAIGTLGRGAAAVKPLLAALGVSGIGSCLGLGWLGAMVLLSGSPMATIALTFFDQGAIDRFGTMAMIAGSRLGSAFVVLCVGFLHDMKARQYGKTTYIGAVSFLISVTLCIPALALGERLLGSQALVDVLTLHGSADADSVLDVVMRPAFLIIDRIPYHWVVFGLGVALLLGAFQVFDYALPDVSRAGSKMAPVGSVFYRPGVMFALGLIVTTLTLSVSVSITVLVPLTARGYVRRENLIPYIMGANISTFVDTLAVSLLVRRADAFAVVLLFMSAVALIAVPIVFFSLTRYERLLDRVTRACTRRPRALALFVAFLFLAPLALLFLTA